MLQEPVLRSTSQRQTTTKSASRRETIQILLQSCLQSNEIQLSTSPALNTILWHEQKLSAGILPEVRIAQEILWELYELNFHFELLALDRRAHTGLLFDAISRQEMILACFPGNEGGSMLVANTELACRGLAAENWKERTPYIIALKNVMKTWRGFSGVGARWVDANSGSEEEIIALEVVIAKFYTQSFFDFFGRAAIVPRRLPS